MAVAAEAHHALRAFKVGKTTVEKLSYDTLATALAPVVGKATAGQAGPTLPDAGEPHSQATR
jgi:hypothetical protein